MDPKYEFNAPQFVDFNSHDNDSADTAEMEKYFGKCNMCILTVM